MSILPEPLAYYELVLIFDSFEHQPKVQDHVQGATVLHSVPNMLHSYHTVPLSLL